MTFQLTLEEFLKRNRIAPEVWTTSACEWDQLLQIAEDHEARLPHLTDTAEFFSRVVQKIDHVHSVRWRVKNTEHLLEKIVRKRAEGNEKYNEISSNNYYEIVTDLVGLRALHLFKNDCFNIDKALREHWTPIENPVAFVRKGDQFEISNQFEAHGFVIKPHPIGYRSVHYVFSTQPLQRKIVVEVQVRTVFEEGWSEIDHHIRYPNFSDNPSVAYFLTIFNRLAGSADEMGGFAKELATTLSELQGLVTEANNEKEQSLRAAETTLEELDKLKQQDAKSREMIAKLKQDVANLRQTTNRNTDLSKELVGLESVTEKIMKQYTTYDLLSKTSLQQAYESLQNLDLHDTINAEKLKKIDGTFSKIKGRDLASLGVADVKKKEGNE